MVDVLVSNLDTQGEKRQFEAHGHAVLANAGAAAILRGEFEPGWRWSEDVKPIVGTDSCKVHHLGYVVSGSMRIRFDDGTEMEVTEGDVFDLPRGHDAWVTSDVPCVMVDYSADATRYARGRPKGIAAPDDDAMSLVRRGYTAFNTGDVDTLRSLFAHDVMHHTAGTGPLAGTYKGADAVLEYFGKLNERCDGTFRADLLEVHGDGHGHVTAVHQVSATRGANKLVSRGSILFTLMGDKITDVLELNSDLPGYDAFMS